jgi:hypothetical protein
MHGQDYAGWLYGSAPEGRPADLGVRAPARGPERRGLASRGVAESSGGFALANLARLATSGAWPFEVELELALLRPVFHRQARHPAELPDVRRG